MLLTTVKFHVCIQLKLLTAKGPALADHFLREIASHSVGFEMHVTPVLPWEPVLDLAVPPAVGMHWHDHMSAALRSCIYVAWCRYTTVYTLKLNKFILEVMMQAGFSYSQLLNSKNCCGKDLKVWIWSTQCADLQAPVKAIALTCNMHRYIRLMS